MAGQGKSRKRLIREIQFLQEQTKPDEPIDIGMLREYLGELTAIRSIIYADFKEMEEMGFGVHHTKNGHYYYDRQSFTPGELALMIDLVCCAGYPDTDSARKLILHIKQMGNNEQFDALSRQENLALRNKTNNPSCIANANLIHEAIRDNKRIRILYAHTDCYGRTKPDKEHEISPYQLIWNNSYLYLIGGVQLNKTVQLRNFRVDKIYDLNLLPQKRIMLPRNHTFYSATYGINAEKYLKPTFDMFNAEGGKTMRITFCVANYLVGAALDVFGQDIVLQEYDTDHMQFTSEVQVTNMFFGWLAKFEYNQLHILEPAEQIESFQAHLRQIIEGYPAPIDAEDLHNNATLEIAEKSATSKNNSQ